MRVKSTQQIQTELERRIKFQRVAVKARKAIAPQRPTPAGGRAGAVGPRIAPLRIAPGPRRGGAARPPSVPITPSPLTGSHPPLPPLRPPKFKLPPGRRPGGPIRVPAVPVIPSPLEKLHPPLPDLAKPPLGERPALPDLRKGDKSQFRGPKSRVHFGTRVPLEPVTEEEYSKAFPEAGPRNVSVPLGPESFQRIGGVKILEGPRALNHEGHLRATGKKCGHWAMYAFLLEVGGERRLGIQFKNHGRYYYPSSNEDDYHAIVNAESGSYWCWDGGIRPGGRSYIAF